MPELVVVEAPPHSSNGSDDSDGRPPAYQAGATKTPVSVVTGGVEVSFANYGALNTSIASHSANTSLAFLAMPGLPDDLSAESADTYMTGLQTLTNGLPPTAMILKGDPSPVFSTMI